MSYFANKHQDIANLYQVLFRDREYNFRIGGTLMSRLPWTPDFDDWPVDRRARSVLYTPDALSITWADAVERQHHVLRLREK